jgi:hypothetical protein
MFLSQAVKKCSAIFIIIPECAILAGDTKISLVLFDFCCDLKKAFLPKKLPLQLIAALIHRLLLTLNLLFLLTIFNSRAHHFFAKLSCY